MSSFNAPRIINYKSTNDLSADSNLFLAVKLDANAQIVLGDAGSLAVGFLLNTPNVDQVAEVAAIGGGAKAVAGGTITAGDQLKVDANGKLVLASVANDLVVAIAQDNAVMNDVFAVEPTLNRIHA